jgi:hypothetical protein
MATNQAIHQRSFIYLGLAGETGRGRTVESGLYRLADGSDEWEALRNGLPDAPAVRALAVHPLNPDLRWHTIRALSQRRSRRALGES